MVGFNVSLLSQARLESCKDYTRSVSNESDSD